MLPCDDIWRAIMDYKTAKKIKVGDYVSPKSGKEENIKVIEKDYYDKIIYFKLANGKLYTHRDVKTKKVV